MLGLSVQTNNTMWLIGMAYVIFAGTIGTIGFLGVASIPKLFKKSFTDENIVWYILSIAFGLIVAFLIVAGFNEKWTG